MNPAPYPPNNTEELQAVITFLGLLNLKYAKPDPKWLDKIPNTDGIIEIVEEDQRPIGKIEVQLRKIPDGQTSYQCPVGLVAYSESTSLPFFLVCVDVGNKKAYFRHLSHWMLPELKPGQQTFVIKFDPHIQSITNETHYLSQWIEIIRDYNRRVSDYPRLRQIETQLDLSHISKEDRIYFQEFIEHVNRLLEIDFPVVKEEFFKGVWKLGVAVSSADTMQVFFQLYNIFPGDPDIRVSGISAHPQKPCSVPPNAESAWLQGTPGNIIVQYNWIARSILKGPSSEAEDFVLKHLTKMLRAKRFSLFGKGLSIEYLFWFVDHYGQSLGIEQTDRLNVSELNYGVFVYLHAWASLAVPKFLGEIIRLNKENLAQISQIIASPPFEDVACVAPLNLRVTKEQVMTLIKSGKVLNPVSVRFTQASLQSLAHAVDFLTESNVEWIDRPYKPRSERPLRIWTGYSVEALRQNVRTILIDSLEDYRLFVQRNRIPLNNSFYLHQPTAIIYAAHLMSWASSKNLENAPAVKHYLVKNDDKKLSKLSFVDLSQFSEKLVVVNGRLIFEGIEREIIGRGEESATDFFKDLPMLHRVYKMLMEDLRGEYRQHFFI